MFRLYEVHCGEMLWSYDEHESTRTRLWRMEGRVPAVGLWTEDSLWIIRVSVCVCVCVFVCVCVCVCVYVNLWVVCV